MEASKVDNNSSKTKAGNWFSRWFTRYLLATELYMVEPWEKVFIHVIFAIVFGLFWYFNYSIIVYVIAQIRQSPHSQGSLT
ncbi:jg27934 [Pararge aegeria aegeria]|uniref:Jg27934 protein n=2 Tax=Pararge aegeria TaxID=116150 RepID=A0A8S4R1M8_9NEOP|nr:jg27934 [Pararge aegeria aegeria]